MGRIGEWLEFQNVSINGDKYPKGFNVKLQSGEELWSGCSGVGLERWAAVFLAQKGLDPANWPEEFREEEWVRCRKVSASFKLFYFHFLISFLIQ